MATKGTITTRFGTLDKPVQVDPGDPGDFCLAGKNAYLIGIGGCGMSGLARMLQSNRVNVQGSDQTPSPTINALINRGFAIDMDQLKTPIPNDCDLVIASAAIKPDHPQLIDAKKRNIPALTYPQALGQCMAGRTGVAIAGTHGKSSTTAILGVALAHAALDPTVIVGANCPQLAGTKDDRVTGFRLGADLIPRGTLKGEPGILLGEACEFNRSFHNLRPIVASIANVEADHLDIYGSLDAVIEAFAGFARLLPPASVGGTLLIAHEGAHRGVITAGLSCKVQTIGFNPAADWVIHYDQLRRRVRVEHQGALAGSWICPMPGVHSATNSAVAFALGCILGAESVALAKGIETFKGLDRRLQRLGERFLHEGAEPVRVYDDYGHHPTEIEATLAALREHEQLDETGRRLVCVFQPHQHSRTRHLLDEFACSFEKADVVIVPQIYFVRDSEKERHAVCAGDLVDRLRNKGVNALHVHPFGAIVDQLELVCRPGDLLVVMGAGPVWQIARDFLAADASPEPIAEKVVHHALKTHQ